MLHSSRWGPRGYDSGHGKPIIQWVDRPSQGRANDLARWFPWLTRNPSWKPRKVGESSLNIIEQDICSNDTTPFPKKTFRKKHRSKFTNEAEQNEDILCALSETSEPSPHSNKRPRPNQGAISGSDWHWAAAAGRPFWTTRQLCRRSPPAAPPAPAGPKWPESSWISCREVG